MVKQIWSDNFQNARSNHNAWKKLARFFFRPKGNSLGPNKALSFCGKVSISQSWVLCDSTVDCVLEKGYRAQFSIRKRLVYTHGDVSTYVLTLSLDIFFPFSFYRFEWFSCYICWKKTWLFGCFFLCFIYIISNDKFDVCVQWKFNNCVRIKLWFSILCVIPFY